MQCINKYEDLSMKVNLLEKVTGFFVTLSITAVIFVTPVMSQEEDEDAAELGKIEVTGSRLKQTDIETAQPVTVITREQIALSGFACSRSTSINALQFIWFIQRDFWLC